MRTCITIGPLPATRFPVAKIDFAPAVSHSDIPREETAGPMRILIADDHEVVRKGICAILSARKDLEVCGEATGGRQAIEKTRELNPDAIIMDVSMPDIDGFAAVREIRTFSHVPIIFLSMHNGHTAIEQSKLVGAQGYVRKMQAGYDLLKALDAVLQNKQFFPPDAHSTAGA